MFMYIKLDGGNSVSFVDFIPIKLFMTLHLSNGNKDLTHVWLELIIICLGSILDIGRI